MACVYPSDGGRLRRPCRRLACGFRVGLCDDKDLAESVVEVGAWWPLRDHMLRPRENLSFGLADSCVRRGLVRGNRGSGPDFVHDGQAQKASSDSDILARARGFGSVEG